MVAVDELIAEFAVVVPLVVMSLEDCGEIGLFAVDRRLDVSAYPPISSTPRPPPRSRSFNSATARGISNTGAPVVDVWNSFPRQTVIVTDVTFSESPSHSSDG
jgi:hypothetical protein